jgi:hypothetical protein
MHKIHKKQEDALLQSSQEQAGGLVVGGTLVSGRQRAIQMNPHDV